MDSGEGQGAFCWALLTWLAVMLGLGFVCFSCTGCSLTLHVDILANNNIFATRSQTSSDDSAPEMLVEGGGTTDAALSVPVK